MFGRENIIGILLLVFCGVVIVIMIDAIITGQIPTVPPALRVPFTVLGIGAMILLWGRWFLGRFRK